MSRIGIIGNAGFLHLPHFESLQREFKETPFGTPSSTLNYGLLQGREVVLVTRNGEESNIAPHLVNYRANIWALHTAGVKQIIALGPFNGVRADMIPGAIVLPDQIIDYTYGRSHTFFEEDYNASRHVDFRFPYSESLRELVIDTAQAHHHPLKEEATYGVLQGPRLASLAEINRLESDGCHVIGMSGMPETVLAQELTIEYAWLGMIMHKAGGRRATVKMAPEHLGPVLKASLDSLHHLLGQAVLNIPVVEDNQEDD